MRFPVYPAVCRLCCIFQKLSKAGTSLGTQGYRAEHEFFAGFLVAGASLIMCQLPVQALAAMSQLLVGTSPSSHDRLLESCSISSDSFGSLPVFDAEGQLVKYEVCSSPICNLS